MTLHELLQEIVDQTGLITHSDKVLIMDEEGCEFEITDVRKDPDGYIRVFVGYCMSRTEPERALYCDGHLRCAGPYDCGWCEYCMSRRVT